MSSGAPRIVTGSPCSLLKLRSLAVVRRPAPHAAAMRSFVDVLPTLPVTPTTGASSRRRAHRARAISACAVSATSIAVPSRRNGSGSLVRWSCGTALAGGPDELVAVAFGDDRDEQLAGRGRAGVERCAVELDVGADQAATDACGRLGCHAILTAADGTVGPMTASHTSASTWWCCSAASRPNTTCRCTTAAHVLRPPTPSRYRITPVGISTEGQWALAHEAVEALDRRARTPSPGRLDPAGTDVSPTPMLADAASVRRGTVVLPLLHGPMGEDGTVQGLLELANVAYVGSRRARLRGRDGQGDGQAGAHRRRHPPGPLPGLRRARDHAGLAAQLADELGLPVFVKPANMGSSVGVSKATTVEELREAIDHALTYDEMIVVEEAIVGREIEVAVLGNIEPEASLPGEIVPGRRVLQLRRQVRHRRRPAA